MNVLELQNRQAELQEECDAIVAKAEAEKRDLSKQDVADIRSRNEAFADLADQIEIANTMAANKQVLTSGAGRQSEPEPAPRLPLDSAGERLPQNHPAAAQNEPPPRRNFAGTTPALPRTDVRGSAGFRNFGEFAQSVIRATPKGGGQLDPRLSQILNAPTTYGQESVGADGGFAVPPVFREGIVEKVMGEDSLWGRTDLQETSSNNFTVPVDETTPWGTTGVQAYWTGEGAIKTQSKPSLGEVTIKLDKLAAIVPVTDELLEDAPALDRYLRRKAENVFDFKLNYALLQGTGAGMPMGLLNSPGTISVAKEGGQAADTLKYENILAMWQRLYAPFRSNAVWITNQSVEVQLNTMSYVPAGGTTIPVYLPAGGVSGSPYATLMGRPVIYSQATNELGDKGDIILADLRQYLAVRKVGGMRSDVSIHLWFDYDVTAFRFVLRVGGQPWWNSAIAARDGSQTYGPTVTLDERA
jgi:HK97 family phage major capsid protein